MTQEDKQLLIKDLSSRVFYGVKVNIERDFPNNPQIVERVAKDGEIIVNGILAYDIYCYKPYLRPMSSMTLVERIELKAITKGAIQTIGLEDIVVTTDKGFDYLNAHHIDYRGLIEMGLALEAPEGMYKN